MHIFLKVIEITWYTILYLELLTLILYMISLFIDVYQKYEWDWVRIFCIPIVSPFLIFFMIDDYFEIKQTQKKIKLSAYRSYMWDKLFKLKIKTKKL